MKYIEVMLDERAYKPSRAYKDDAGMDLYMPDQIGSKANGITIFPGESARIDTGVHVRIPSGYAGFLKSKSGLNVKKGIQSEGVIDAGYTGSIVAKLYNNGTEPALIRPGDKITQLVILPVETPEIVLVGGFAETERGDNGFGSTGR